tara:strand:- start:219 stop:836 length:618 start_codon:yes stop_codon:yes gene_type:complete
MKHLFFATLLLVSSFIFSQGMRNGGGGMNQQNRQGATRAVQEFNASDAAGIFYYETDEVIKKIKVKDDQLKFKVKKALSNYNFKIKEIAFLNSVKLNDLDKLMAAMRDSQPTNLQDNSSNSDERQNMRKAIGKVIRPIKEEILSNEEVLNKTLEEILSEKQNKKWLKYQNNIKESLQPKRSDNNGQNRMQRMNGRGGGSGGMRRQ